MRRKIISAVLLILLVMVAATAVAYANKYAKTSAEQQIRLETNQTELKKVNNQLNDVKQEKIKQNDNSQQQIQKLEQEKKDLEGQLQARVEQKAKLAAAQKLATVVVPKTLVSNIVSGCGGDQFANYIYSHESGCNLSATNAEGCIGIGQACPASKLLAVCPNLDYDCQHNFFTGYAVARYGSWEGAYNFWVSNHWW